MPLRRSRTWLAPGALVAIVAIVIGWPAARVLFAAVSAGGRRSAAALPVSLSPALLAESVGWAGLIALIATILAWPGAWLIRRAGWRAAPWIAAPMLLPPYLAYAGWNLLRAPDTWPGAWIERLAAHGHRWAPIASGRALAVLGLALWAAPLAAFTIALTLRRIDDDLLDQMRLDGGRARDRLRLALPGPAASVVFITLLMLGSAVPLHLAQVPTWSIVLWQGLDLTPPGEHWRLWARAWPLLLIIAGGLALLARLARPGSGWAGPTARARARPGPWSVLGAVIVPVLGVGAPLLLFAVHLRSARSLATFWRVSGRAVVDGLAVAAAVGAVSMLVVLLAWAAMPGPRAGRQRGLVAGLVIALAVTALMPGVLVGSAVAGAWDRVALVRESMAILVLAHLARFAALPALAGLWLRSAEPREDREARLVDGAGTLAGWARACWPGQAGVILSAGLAAAVLSFFEIESSVVVQPVHVENLSRQLLGYLHFARTEEMSAAAVTLLAAGVVAAAATGWLARRSLARP